MNNVKKIISSLLVAVIILTAAPLSGFVGLKLNFDWFDFGAKAASSSFERMLESIEIYTKPEKLKYYYEVDGSESYYEDYDEESDSYNIGSFYQYNILRTGLRLKLNYTDGSSELTEENDEYYYNDNEITVEWQNNHENWDIGIHKVTVSYLDKSVEYDVSIIENPVESIELITGPKNSVLYENVDGWLSKYDDWDEDGNYEKKEYFDYEVNSCNGFKLKYNLKNGESVIGDENLFTENYTISGQEYGEIWDIGNHTASINLMNCSVDFNVTIIENPVQSIRVVSLPNRTEYFVGIDATKETSVDYQYDESGDLIEIERDYYSCPINEEELEIEVCFTDGSKKVVNCSYEFKSNGRYYWININQEADEDRINEWKLGENKISVTFMGRTASFNVNLTENPYSGIEFTKLNIKESYIQNEYIDIYGSEITVYLKNGESQKFVINEEENYNKKWSVDSGVLNNYTWYLSQEDTNAEFSYLGYTIDIPIVRSNKRIDSFQFITEPQSFDAVGSEFALNYSDGTSVNGTIIDFDSREGDGGDLVFEGGLVKTTVGIFDGWFEISNYKDIKNSVYRFGIASRYKTDKAVYTTSINKNPILCYYSYHLIRELSYYSWGYSYNSKNGVYYDGSVNQSNINLLLFISNRIVGDYENMSIDVETANQLVSSIFDVSKMDWNISNLYDKSTGFITFPDVGGFGEGSRYKIISVDNINGDIYIEINKYNADKLETFYFVYHDYKCTYFGKVKKDFSEIEIISNPFKKSYYEQESIDSEGLMLKYTDNNGNTQNVNSGFTIYPEIVSANTKEILISYNGITISVPVEVIPIEEIGIELSSSPTKLNYKCGEKFDSTGLTISITYNSGKRETINSGYTCTPEYLTVPGNQTITVYYHGFTTTFAVNVSNDESNIDKPAIHSVNIDDVALNYKKSTTIKPTIKADDGAKYKVEYSTSNAKVATVDKNGKVTATKRGSGTATITCTVTDSNGNVVKDTCKVKVSLTWWQWIITIVLFGWIWY